MDRRLITVMRLAMALAVTPVFCLWAYEREVRLEPLLGGAGVLFYGVGFFWLFALLLISGWISRAMKVRLTAWPVLAISAVVGLYFEIAGDNPAHDNGDALTVWLDNPLISHPLLFNLAMGLVFVIISGMNFRIIPAEQAHPAVK